MKTIYAVLAITEFYGSKTQKQVMVFATSRANAVAQAAQMENAANEEYGCQMLSHNQASGTNYVVRRVDVSRCARGYAGARVYLGEYVPS